MSDITFNEFCEAKSNKKDNPLDIQIGGTHYKNFPIQPVEFITKNEIGFLPGCVIKRMTRFNHPGGKGLEDLKKAIHEIELIIRLEGYEK